MPEVQANGLRFHYQQSGEGPDVVLVHAVTSNLAVWMFTGLVETLAAEFRVTLYDMRGHGFSERPATGYSSRDMAADYAALHEALGLKPAYLVGHSFGGVVGLHSAILSPDRVAGVILSDSFFPGLKRIEPNFGKMNIWADLRETFSIVGVDLGETVDFNRLFHSAAKLNREQMKTLEEKVGVFGQGWLRQLPKLAETTCGNDVLSEAGLTAEAIAGVRRPIVGLYDEFSPFLATGEWLKNNVTNCQTEIIPGAKHLAMMESTEAFIDAVRRHLRTLSGKTAATNG